MGSAKSWTIAESIAGILSYLSTIEEYKGRHGQRSPVFRNLLEKNFNELYGVKPPRNPNSKKEEKGRTGCAILSQAQRLRTLFVQLKSVFDVLQIFPSFRETSHNDRIKILAKLYTEDEEVLIPFLEKVRDAKEKNIKEWAQELEVILSREVDFDLYDYCRERYNIWSQLNELGVERELMDSRANSSKKNFRLEIPSVIRKKRQARRSYVMSWLRQNRNASTMPINSQQTPSNENILVNQFDYLDNGAGNVNIVEFEHSQPAETILDDLFPRSDENSSFDFASSVLQSPDSSSLVFEESTSVVNQPNWSSNFPLFDITPPWDDENWDI